MSTVVLERLEPADYESGCVALPTEYGTAAWEARPENAAVRRAVLSALDRLDAETGVGRRFEGRTVLVKPNLVVVYRGVGLVRGQYPETTDPRVLDAVVEWLANRGGRVVIVESSGRGSPTRASFRIAGLDRLARRRGCGLVALEEQPVDRYFLPKASVQREILVPRIFSAVVRGEAAYVSVPKLKTNLYAGVTLGFKNAMGVIPYNLRQRDHNHGLDRKLVEMLYLFRPDLVLIDGVVGGEGECPAPVDPVDSRVVIAGDHAVETDRVATELMGLDPARIELMRVADELGFGSTEPVRVIGDVTPTPFRPADASLVSDRVRRRFPKLTVLVGLARDPGAAAAAVSAGGPGVAGRLEASCRGGCVASTRFGLAMLEAEGLDIRKPVLVALGPGIETADGRRWFDADGRAWDEAAIRDFRGRSAVVGSCGRTLAPSVDRFVEGCMPLANAPHAILHRLSGTSCALLSVRNRRLPTLLRAMLEMRAARIRLLRKGERLDVAFPLGGPAAGDEPPRGDGRDWVPWPLPPLTDRRELRRLVAAEDDTMAASLTGVMVTGFVRRLAWRAAAVGTGLATLAPPLLGILAALGLRTGLPAGAWFGVTAAVEVLHAAELPFALGARRKASGGALDPRDTARTVAATLTSGFPAWVPWKLGVFGTADMAWRGSRRVRWNRGAGRYD